MAFLFLCRCTAQKGPGRRGILSPRAPAPLCRFHFCAVSEMRLFQRPARSRTPFQKSHSARPPARPPAFHRPGPPRQERPARLPGSPRPRAVGTASRWAGTARQSLRSAAPCPPSAAVAPPARASSARWNCQPSMGGASNTGASAGSAARRPRRLPRHCSSSGRVRGHGGGRGACPAMRCRGSRGRSCAKLSAGRPNARARTAKLTARMPPPPAPPTPARPAWPAPRRVGCQRFAAKTKHIPAPHHKCQRYSSSPLNFFASRRSPSGRGPSHIKRSGLL